jgi:transposase, IS5 family
MMAGRYAHAKQFNRHRRQLRILRTRLGRLIRDIRRKIGGQEHIAAAFEAPLARASQIRSQQQRQRGWKLYSFHAPETECIGKGKASAPYEFGVKASIVTTNARAPGGQFVLHAKALPGNPYDGHTLRDVIEDTQKLTGREIERAYVDKGYRGHDAQNPRRVFISGQKRGVFGTIKRELRRRSAIEPVIGHMKSEGHLGRCYLKGRAGDAANAILTAVGYNFRRVLAWLRALLRQILIEILRAFIIRSAFDAPILSNIAPSRRSRGPLGACMPNASMLGVAQLRVGLRVACLRDGPRWIVRPTSRRP